jgi:uncharacterized damage-inducible protein DinB
MDDGIVEAIDYDRWATATMITMCRELPDDVLDARLPHFSGSCRELLLHVVGGQQTFALRTNGRQHEGELNRGSAWPGFDALAAIAAESSAALVEAARGHGADAEVDLPYRRVVYRYPVRFLLVHAVEHGVEHRTEIKLQLAQLGVETPDLDGWSYAESAGYGAVVG